MAEFRVETDLTVIENTQIVANFDEVLAAVKELVAPYKTMVVMPDGISEAKADRAKLNNLAKRIDDQRKAVKQQYEKPLKEFEAKFKPILDEIKEGSANIDRQVKEAENAEKEEKLKELEAFFEEKLPSEIEGYINFPKLREMFPKWVNKGCSMTEAQNDIMVTLANVQRGVQALRGYPQEYKAVLLERFRSRYDMGDVVSLYAQIKQREAFEAQREAAKKKEAEKPVNQVPLTPQNAQQIPIEDDSPAQPALRVVEFWVEVTTEQGRDLGVYLRSKGIRYGKVKR